MTGELSNLPSEDSIAKMIRGEPGGIPDALFSTVFRALLISIPFFVLKIEPKKVLYGSLAASGIISLLIAGKILAEGTPKA